MNQAFGFQPRTILFFQILLWVFWFKNPVALKLIHLCKSTILQFFFFFFLSDCAGSLLLLGLFLVGVQATHCSGFFLWSTGSRHTGFSDCGTWAQHSRCSRLVAPRHAESSGTRDRTHVPRTSKQISIYCTTREFLYWVFKLKILYTRN